MEKYEPLPGPPPRRENNEGFAPPPGPPPSQFKGYDQYAPPPGPPPSRDSGHGRDDRPDVPPYSHAHDSSTYPLPSRPPPGPSASGDQFAPPPGPPPGRNGMSETQPPPSYQDWMSVPDTSQLPPPPAIGNEFSPTSNADASDADQARDWCRRYPLMKPAHPTREQHIAGKTGNVVLQKPPSFNGSITPLSPGMFRGNTKRGCRDACLITSVPLYFAQADSPWVTNKPATVYFEVKIASLGRHRQQDENSIAIGFCAVPYPTWRMPGWERGSLAIHSDDGNRYVSDNEGGKDFTSPFKDGETIGLGINFTHPGFGQSSTSGIDSERSLNGEVFFTRGGRRAGSWDLHEEVDSEHDRGTHGLDGGYDLYGSVGVYGAVAFEMILDPRKWLWRPS